MAKPVGLILTGTAGDVGSSTVEGVEMLSLPRGTTDFVLTAASADGTSVLANLVWTADGEPFTTPEVPVDATSVDVAATFADTKVTYEVTGTVGGAPKPVSASIVVDIGSAATEEEDGEEEEELPDRVVEASIGEFGPVFALLSGMVVAAAAILVLWMTWSTISAWVPHVAAGSGACVLCADGGTWMEHLRGIVTVGLMGIGGATILFAGWLMAIETRARTRLLPKKNDAGIEVREISMDAVETAAKAFGRVVGALRVTRGSVALLAVGLLLVVLAWVGTLMSAPSAPAPQPTPTQTATT